jgi:hypothetical protein
VSRLAGSLRVARSYAVDAVASVVGVTVVLGLALAVATASARG